MSNQITTISPAEMPAEELALAIREYQLAKLPAKQRAAIAIDADGYREQADSLKTEASKITAVTDKTTRGLAHDIGMGLKRLRTGMESTAKTVREGAVEYQKAVISVAAELSGSSKPAEDAMFGLRDEFDAKDKARKSAHEDAIRAISARAILPASLSSVELRAAISATHAGLAAREWEEYRKQAQAAADATLAVLEMTLALALEREAAEAKASEEAARAEAERLAREAVERAAREAAEREAARVAALKTRLIDLELGIARQIRRAQTTIEAQPIAHALAERRAAFGSSEAESWEEFAHEAGQIVEDGWKASCARLDDLARLEAMERQAEIDRLAREAAEREAAALAQKIAAERVAREAEERVATEAQAKAAEEARLREAATEQAAIAAEAAVDGLTPPPVSEPAPTEIRWGELCAAMGCEIPPWVLAAMGCESVAGNYTPESLQALVDSLDAIRERVAGLIK